MSIIALGGISLSMACTSAISTTLHEDALYEDALHREIAYGAGLLRPTLQDIADASGSTPRAVPLQPMALLEVANAPVLAADTAPPPTYPSFNSPRLDEQLQIYTQYLMRFGPPDVLIVGSSRALQGIDPVTLQQTLESQGFRGIRVYNFSINGATARVVDLVVRRILAPEHLPRLLIWADGSRAINSGRADRTYSGIASSEGYKRLATGNRPIYLPPPPVGVSDLCFDLLEADLAAIDDPICQDSLPLLTESATSPGDMVLGLPSVPVHTVNTDLDAFGFQSVVEQFNPTTYYRRFPRVSGRYDNSYVPFRLGGEQSIATARLAAFARDRQIPLIFVNLPLSASYLDPIRSNYERQFDQHMTQLARQHGFLFRNLLRLWPSRNDYFADPSHINRYGARAVALHLGRDRSIPWPRPRSQ